MKLFVAATFNFSIYNYSYICSYKRYIYSYNRTIVAIIIDAAYIYSYNYSLALQL